MKISTVLDHIDSGFMALPEFQRGYVWNREQVRSLFHSLYHRHPVGGLLVWDTESKTASHRGDGLLAAGVVKLLLDGQQRMTSLYGVARGVPPKFFDGNKRVFTGLYFHLENESFEFYQAVKMQDDPLWINVTELMQKGNDGLGEFIQRFTNQPELVPRMGDFSGRLSRLLGILEINLHVEEVTGTDMTPDVVVDIFNRVNSGGTKLSKGDLALAKICAEWPEGRKAVKVQLEEWAGAGFHFSLDWLLRSVNTVLTGEARFEYLHDKSPEDVQDALTRACRHVNKIINLIAGRLGLDHDRVFFGRFAVPVMAHYLDQRWQRGLGSMSKTEQDKLLFWYLQAAMWGRFSGSTESFIDKDLEALNNFSGGVDKLLDQLRLWHGGLGVEAAHFNGWSLGARFYPVLYLLTRMGEARDWGNGLPLKAGMLGNMSQLEVHHIFPKSKLYKKEHTRPEVNALANFCFQTKETNLDIGNSLPEEYFPQIEEAHPGALASQWIPVDPVLWKLDHFLDFLEARKMLLAAELNNRMKDLLHGDTQWLAQIASPPSSAVVVVGGISSEEEEAELENLNDWVFAQGLKKGSMALDYANPQTGVQIAVFDLAWPTGLQEGLSEPVAVLLNEEAATITLASQAGYKCFTNTTSFRAYVKNEVCRESADA